MPAVIQPGTARQPEGAGTGCEQEDPFEESLSEMEGCCMLS